MIKPIYPNSSSALVQVKATRCLISSSDWIVVNKMAQTSDETRYTWIKIIKKDVLHINLTEDIVLVEEHIINGVLQPAPKNLRYGSTLLFFVQNHLLFSSFFRCLRSFIRLKLKNVSKVLTVPFCFYSLF